MEVDAKTVTVREATAAKMENAVALIARTATAKTVTARTAIAVKAREIDLTHMERNLLLLILLLLAQLPEEKNIFGTPKNVQGLIKLNRYAFLYFSNC